MRYDFSIPIERRNTNCVKYDFFEENGFPEDTIPLWVADMDFPSPVEVSDRLREVVSHGTFGYSNTKDGYFNALRDWFARRHRLDIQPQWLVKTSGVMCAIAAGIRAFTEKGDGVLIQQPVYGAFEHIIKANGRKCRVNALVNENGRYCMDLHGFEQSIRDNNIKLFIFCSPHNPVGRVWTKNELERMGEICLTYDLIVISDEIHCDFTYADHTFISLASVSPQLAQRSVICTAPSKTFNLAGLNTANIFVPDEQLRGRLENELRAAGTDSLNIFGMAACEAAYSCGDNWLSQLQSYLQGNLEFLRGYLSEYLPQIRLTEPEGTYLTWLDFRRLNLSDGELDDIIKRRARLWLSRGESFGSQGKGFWRVNIACPQSLLNAALQRLRQALNN